MPGGNTRSWTHFDPYPLVFSRAEGAYLWDADGNPSTTDDLYMRWVAVLSGGDELVGVDGDAAGGRIVSSNSYALQAQCREAGAEAHYLGIARDTPESLAEVLQAGLHADVIVSSAGVSVGDRDYVRPVLEYAAGAWMPAACKTAIDHLDQAQRLGHASSPDARGTPGRRCWSVRPACHRWQFARRCTPAFEAKAEKVITRMRKADVSRSTSETAWSAPASVFATR